MFLRLVLIEVVFVRSRTVLRMLAMLCRLSSFLIVRIFFLDHLACVFLSMIVFIWCCVRF